MVTWPTPRLGAIQSIYFPCELKALQFCTKMAKKWPSQAPPPCPTNLTYASHPLSAFARIRYGAMNVKIAVPAVSWSSTSTNFAFSSGPSPVLSQATTAVTTAKKVLNKVATNEKLLMRQRPWRTSVVLEVAEELGVGAREWRPMVPGWYKRLSA